MKQKNPSREVREQGAPQESVEGRTVVPQTPLEKYLAESLEKAKQELAALRAEPEEVQRAKYGTPCKCESWIAACAVAEKRAEAAEAALATARREACREAVNNCIEIVLRGGTLKGIAERLAAHLQEYEAAERRERC